MASAGCRRLWALIRGLPPESALMRGGKQWTWEHELMATTIEVIDFWGRIGAISHGVKPDRLPDPVRIEHPDRRGGEQEQKKVTTNPAEIAAWFRRHIGR